MPTPSIARRILVPLDGGTLSISALPYLRTVASSNADITLHGPVGRMVLGSVADRVARSALIPVMLFRPHPLTIPIRSDLDVPLQRVVVPFDGSDFAREALPVMTSHGEGGVRRSVVGSVAEKLIHQAVAPLVLVPSAQRAAIIACQKTVADPAWQDGARGRDRSALLHKRDLVVAKGTSRFTGAARCLSARTRWSDNGDVQRGVQSLHIR